MVRIKKNQSGVALMIVLSAITFLTAVGIQFAYDTNVNYHLAMNDKENLQAFMLAESAINLMKLELKLEKELRSQAASAAQGQSLNANLNAPLCQQFPISTDMIRSLFLGDTSAGEAPAKKGAEKGTDEKTGENKQMAFVGGMQVETAQEFLDFTGDFEGECIDESSKFNLNIFFNKDPQATVVAGLNDYDKAKQLLINILQRPEHKNLFTGDPKKQTVDIARNIADWVDSNDRMNDQGGLSTGSESSLYKAGGEYDVKNGKFLTLEELFKVAGIEDDWFLPIKDNFTVYGEDKVNICLATDEVVAALIVQYANSNPNVADVDPNDKERARQLVEVVKNGCTGVKPDAAAISTALNAALGSTQQTSGEGGSTADFSSMITTESRFYTLIGKGRVGETEVKVTAVLDTKETQAANWKFVYWRVE